LAIRWHCAGARGWRFRPRPANVNTGQFEVYDIAGNQLVGVASLGTVGLDWQMGGFRTARTKRCPDSMNPT